jgi:orotate phosphoribosyltransferase
MKVVMVDDVMTAGTAVRESIPKLKAEADVEVVGLVLAVDRMEQSKGSEASAVQTIEREFSFPVRSIVNVRQIFQAAAEMQHGDGSALLSADIQQAAEEYLARYGSHTV